MLLTDLPCLLYYTIQAYLPRGGTTPSGLSSPTLNIITTNDTNQENARRFVYRQSDVGIFFICGSFCPDDYSLCQADKNQQQIN